MEQVDAVARGAAEDRGRHAVQEVRERRRVREVTSWQTRVPREREQGEACEVSEEERGEEDGKTVCGREEDGDGVQEGRNGWVGGPIEVTAGSDTAQGWRRRGATWCSSRPR